MKKIGLFILLMLVSANSTMYAQEKKSRKERQQEQAEKVQKMVEAQNYKFVAQRALPMSMRSVNLTSEYEMSVSKDTIKAHLPYFGRAYVAPMNPLEGGIRFESKDFIYRLENTKRGGWTAYINIIDAARRIEMILNVTTGGSASLLVNDNVRQSISFNGYVEELKK
jgi:hypothetical protein